MGVVGSGYKLIADVDAESGALVPRELFELATDPTESASVLDDPAHARARDALVAWLETAVAEGRAAASASAASEMDPATEEWMRAMGYIR